MVPIGAEESGRRRRVSEARHKRHRTPPKSTRLAEVHVHGAYRVSFETRSEVMLRILVSEQCRNTLVGRLSGSFSGKSKQEMNRILQEGGSEHRTPQPYPPTDQLASPAS